MKCNRTKQVLWIVGILLMTLPQNMNGQFLKKLKQQAEEKIIKKADKKVGDILDGKQDSGNGTSTQTETTTQPEVQKTEQKASQQNTTLAYNEDDYLVYKSPDPAFKDIVVQKFKDLPRFGAIDSYMMQDNPKKVDLSKEAGEKRNLTGIGYTGFAHLVRIHSLKEHFKVMDRTALTQQTKGKIIEEEAKSSLAQKVLKEFAFDIGSDVLKKEYFMNDWSGTGKSALVREWGGHQADDFTENERYVSFVEKYLDIILKWSESFYTDGTEDFQSVHAIKFQGQYDFDKGGFWIRLPIKRPPLGVSSVEYFSEFLPNTPYGQQFYNKTEQVDYINGDVLFKMSPDKAESLINDKTVLLQMTMKVRSVFKGFDTANPFVYSANYTYHFLDPILELFSDAQLTKKIGEIDLNKLVYKEPN